MIGVAATSALVLEQAWFSREATASSADPPAAATRGAALGTLAAILLAFTQLIHGPVTALLASRIHRRDGQDFAVRAAWTRAHLGDPLHADVGVVRGMAGSFFTPFALDARGHPPERWRVLSHGGHVLVLHPNAKTFELVVAENRSLYPMGEQNLYRSPDAPLRAGDVIRATGMTVTILDVGAIGPRRVRFVFDDEPVKTSWIADNFEATVGVELPAIGQGAPFDP